MFKNAFSKIYTKDYIDGWASQMDYIINSIDDSSKTIVDIASGKGYLVEKLLAETDNQIIATDFSPTILKRNKEYYKFKGLYDRLSLIAFDARKTPFKNNSIEILTSNLGLPNIEHPGSVVSELNRVLKEKFMSIMMFFDESDIVHLDLLMQYGLFAYATRNKALETFRKSAWRISLENQVIVKARPTPVGEIIEGGRIDGLPIEDTKLEFCVLVTEK